MWFHAKMNVSKHVHAEKHHKCNQTNYTSTAKHQRRNAIIISTITKPSAAQQVFQFHVDWVNGAELARQERLPRSRGCQDHAHLLRNVRRVLVSKLRQRTQLPGKTEKWVFTHLGRVQLFKSLQHIVPTLELHCLLLQAFLHTLTRVWGEPAAAAYLRNEYLSPLERHVQLMPDGPSGHALLSPSWAGACGQVPSTGCGSQPVEVYHETWQRNLNAQGTLVTLLDVLPTMSLEYRTCSRP